jgi:hypothetical protein
MHNNGDKKLENLRIEDGGTARERRTHAEVQLERDLRALFVACCGKDGRALNRNYANVANGHTTPWRALVRRIKEAKLARAPKGYEQGKALAQRIDQYVDELYDRRHHTGDYDKAG